MFCLLLDYLLWIMQLCRGQIATPGEEYYAELFTGYYIATSLTVYASSGAFHLRY